MTNRKHMCAFIPHLKEVGIPACGRNFGGCRLLSVTDGSSFARLAAVRYTVGIGKVDDSTLYTR